MPMSNMKAEKLTEVEDCTRTQQEELEAIQQEADQLQMEIQHFDPKKQIQELELVQASMDDCKDR